MRIIREEGLEFLGWRSVPVDNKLPVRDGQGGGAGAPADLHRPAEGDEGPGRVRAPALPHPQGRLQRALLRLQGPATSATTPCRCRAARWSTRACSCPTRWQGYYTDVTRPASRLGDGAGASALLHQHLPVVEARASLPHGRAQRRDQHLRGNVNWMAARQASVSIAAVRRRHHQAVADLLRGPVRHRLLRQRARVPGDGRLQPGACGHDADPRGVGRQSADGWQAPRLLRVSRLPDGAVGRPGRHGLHRRAPDRRHARPQRLAARALSRHQGRPGDHVVGGRRAAGRGGEHRPQVAPAAGQDAADRPGGGPHHLR